MAALILPAHVAPSNHVRPADIFAVLRSPDQDGGVDQHSAIDRRPGHGELTMTENIQSVMPRAGTQLPAHIEPASAEFDLSALRVFDSLPDHRDFGIVAMRGVVVIYDEKPLHVEGVIEGGFYVRESQRPNSMMEWDHWLRQELAEPERRAGPRSPLRIRREVVQAVRWRNDRHWALRMVGGHVDGPYHDWAFGTDLIGKVAGIYLPSSSAKGC